MTTSLKLSQKTIKIGDSEDEVCLILFDLAGEDVFETLIEPHFDLIGMFIVCFDLTNKQSFEHVRKWEKKLRALGVNVKGMSILPVCNRRKPVHGTKNLQGILSATKTT